MLQTEFAKYIKSLDPLDPRILYIWQTLSSAIFSILRISSSDSSFYLLKFFIMTYVICILWVMFSTKSRLTFSKYNIYNIKFRSWLKSKYISLSLCMVSYLIDSFLHCKQTLNCQCWILSLKDWSDPSSSCLKINNN